MDLDFPAPKPPKVGPTFAPGDSVIVTTSCEDIQLHDLTGVVHRNNSTGSVRVRLDVDDSLCDFLPHEIGHRF